MKTILRVITHKLFVIAVVGLLELGLILTIVLNLSLNYALVYSFMVAFSIFLVIYVVNRNDNPIYQLAWSLFIMAIPPLGTVFYFIFAERKVPKTLRMRVSEVYGADAMPDDSQEVREIEENYPAWTRLIHYIKENSEYPVYGNTKALYLETGEVKFEKMKEALLSAESFILLEYFIIKDGIMWQAILSILKQKVEQGVTVRVLFDDWGTALFRDLEKQCQEAGIEAVFFNPIALGLRIQTNNRDHRKILVIDGKIGFMGGINIADEYINIGSKFGHWKDTAVMIEGDAVYSLTLMFMQMYQFYKNDLESPSYYKYDFPYLGDQLGYVIPYADVPTDHRDVGLDVHLSMIYGAQRYIYMMTPYLIIGYELIQALSNAARSGVDVRIILPGVPDKKFVNQVTKSNYEALVKSGVRIYEYSPGFVHSKTVVIDDEIATVGTINMDYRSYYMNYECSTLFIGNDLVRDAYEDVILTLELSQEITYDMCRAPWLTRWLRSFLRIFGGLM